MKSIIDSLLEEIENMSVEEYLAYHEEAIDMQKKYDEMIDNVASTCKDDLVYKIKTAVL